MEEPKKIVLLRMEEVAKILQISPSQAYHLARIGALPSIRFSRAVRVRPEDLEAFLSKNRFADEQGGSDGN